MNLSLEKTPGINKIKDLPQGLRELSLVSKVMESGADRCHFFSIMWIPETGSHSAMKEKNQLHHT